MMKIAVLSRNRKLYSTRRLVEEGVNRGHEVRVIDCLHCSMNITSANPAIHYHQQVLEDFDVVIPRIGASVTFYGTAVLRQFEMMGTFSGKRVGGHYSLPRQTALAAAVGPQRRRHARHRLCQQAR